MHNAKANLVATMAMLTCSWLLAMNEYHYDPLATASLKAYLNSLLKITDAVCRWPNKDELLVIREWVLRGADPSIETDFVDGKNGSYRWKPLAPRGALHFAAEVGDVSLIECLIAHGAQINAKSDNYTPLASAVYYGHKDAVFKLIELGAEIFTSVIGLSDMLTSKMLKGWVSKEVILEGEPLLHQAIRLKHYAALEKHLSEALIDLSDKYQRTPWDVALGMRDVRALLMLRAHGADLTKVRFKPYIDNIYKQENHSLMPSPLYQEVWGPLFKNYLAIILVFKEFLPRELVNYISEMMLYSYQCPKKLTPLLPEANGP